MGYLGAMTRGQRLFWTGLLCALLLGLGGYLLGTPYLVPGLDRSTHERPSPRLFGGVVIEQFFRSPQADLTGIRIKLGTYYRRSHDSTRFQLYRLTAAWTDHAPPGLEGLQLVHEEIFNSSKDNRPRAFSFNPQADSEGADYMIRLSAPGGDEPGSVIWWLGSGRAPHEKLVINGLKVDGRATFETLHLSAESRWAELIRRFSETRPGWGTFHFAWPLTLFLWLAVVFSLRSRNGRWARATLWSMPLVLLLTAVLWCSLAQERGLLSEYRSGPRESDPVVERRMDFLRDRPGQRPELDPHFNVHDVSEMGLNPNRFGISWLGRLVVPRPGEYEFELTGNGRVRLALNGAQVLDTGPPRGRSERNRVRLTLPAGLNPIRMGYAQDRFGRAGLLVRWGPAGEQLRRLEAEDVRPWVEDRRQGGTDGTILAVCLILLYGASGLGMAGLVVRLASWLNPGPLRPEVHLPILLGLVALIYRGIYVFESRAAHFGLGSGFDLFGWDQATYLYQATGVVKGFWPFLHHGPFPFGQGFVFFLSGLMAILGRDILILRLGLGLVGVVTTLVACRLAWRVFNPSAGMAAGLLTALGGMAVVHETAFLVAGPMTLLVLLGALKIHEAVRTGGDHGSWLTAGLALGLAAVFRSNLVLAMPFLGVAILWPRENRAARFKGLLLTALLFSLLTLLPAFWNMGWLGKSMDRPIFTPTANGAATLWLGNSRNSNGILAHEDPDLSRRLANRETTYGQEVRDFIRTEPEAYLKLLGTKAWRFLNGWEVPNNVDYYAVRETTGLIALGGLNMALLGPLGLAGLALAMIRKERVGPLAGLLLGLFLASVAFHIFGRFRVPVLPLLACFGGYALTRMGGGLKPALTSLGLMVLFYLGVNWDQVFHPQAAWPWEAWQWWNLDYPYFP